MTFNLQVHALLDQFKKFSGVVKQMGGVKELFKDEKQVKNLNPQKMGKVCHSIFQASPAFMSKMDFQPLIPNAMPHSVLNQSQLLFRCTRAWLKLWTLKCLELLVECRELRA